MHYNREMDEEDEEVSRIVHVRSLSGSPPWTIVLEDKNNHILYIDAI